VKVYEPVECGCCGRAIRRAFYPDGRKHDDNQVHSRTLVRGEFLPSCSPRCWQALRADAGLQPPTVRAA